MSAYPYVYRWKQPAEWYGRRCRIESTSESGGLIALRFEDGTGGIAGRGACVRAKEERCEAQ